MAISPINNFNKLRLTGLSSGIDTDTMIKQMLRLSQFRIDSKMRAITKLEWKQTALNDVASQLTDFRWKYLTVMGADAMRQSSVYNSTVVASMTGANRGAVSIDTTINSAAGTMRIGEIQSLAKASSVVSTGSVSRTGNGFNLTDKLGSLQMSNGNIAFDSKGEARVNINGTDVVLKNAEINDYVNNLKADYDVYLDNYKAAHKDAAWQEFKTANPLDGFIDEEDQYNAFEMGYVYSDRGRPLHQYDKIKNVLTGDKYVDYINAKIMEKDGRQITFQKDRYGNEYADISVNGKQGIKITKNDYQNTLGEAMGKNSQLNTAISSWLNNTTVNINGTIIEISKSDSIARINEKLVDAGGADMAGDGTDVINGQTVAIDPDDSTDTIMRKVNATATGVDVMKYYDEAEVRINGESILVKRTDTINDINEKLAAAGADTIDFDNAGRSTTITIDTKTSYSSVTNTVRLYETDFERSFINSGLVKAANAAPRYLTFDWKNDSHGTTNITLNGLTIELNSNMTIEDMINTVNNSRAGVTMKYDKMSDQFTIENKKVGPASLTVAGMGAFGIANGTYDGGSMARVVINGEMVERDSNTFEFRGVNITLNEVSVAKPGEDYEETVVTFKRDATESVNKIRSFIDGYNVIIKKLEDLLKEKKTGKEVAYGPLTEEEKSVMTDKQIEDWEAIAKKGILRNDFGIQSMITSLRGALFETVKGAGLSPAEIGLSTGYYFDNMGSQIVIDEAKLKAALESDPERVMNVFMGGSDSKVSAERGLLWRMEDIMLGYTNGSQSVSLNSLASSISRENAQIDRLQQKMWEEEERMYAKFAAMETALSKLQEQSDWFAQMMGNF